MCIFVYMCVFVYVGVCVVHVCIYVYVVHVCVRVCMHRSEVDTRYLPQLLPTLFLHQGLLLNPQLIDLVSLAIQIA